MSAKKSTKTSKGDARVGTPVDLAEMALWHWWTGTERNDLFTHDIACDAAGKMLMEKDPAANEWHLGLEWPQPRDVRQVVVEFDGAAPGDVAVQYWRRNWPTPAPERLPGARRGWIGTDDPFHGTWTTIRGRKEVKGATFAITADPLDLTELGGRGVAEQLDAAQDFRAPFRHTLKVRIVTASSERPRIAAVHVYSGSTWQEGEVTVRLGADGKASGDWSGHVEVANGVVLGVAPVDFSGDDVVADDSSWRLHLADKSAALRVRLLYAQCSPTSEDRTVVTVYSRKSFSFLVADLARGPIYIKPYDALVSWAKEAPDWAAFQKQLAANPKTIYERVQDEPEQSLGRAMSEIPPLDVTKQAPFGRYAPLGVEAGRQEWGLRYNGELFADKRILKLFGRDSARLQWPSQLLRFRFGTGDPPDFREGDRYATKQSLLEGWMPVITSEWLDREIEYTQTSFAALVDGPVTPGAARRGDEDMAVMMRIKIRNTTHYPKRARLWVAIAPQEEVEYQEGLLLAQGRVVPAEPVKRQWKVQKYGSPCLRAAVKPGGKGKVALVAYAETAEDSKAIPGALAYDVDLAGGESETITFAFPFVSFTTAAEWQKVAALDYDAKLADVVAYWSGYIASGGALKLPDSILDDFSKAVRAHVAIAVDKDPISGLTVVPAGAWTYAACGNEGCWQITMLDQAGHHDRAEDYLETYLATQGAKPLDGNFASAEGALLSLDMDDGVPVSGHFAYNLDHGYIMECMVSHYRYTANRAWLEHAAPYLVKGCDMVTRERARTMVKGQDGRPDPAWGLMPAGHLEDNQEWRHWFAVNAHAYNGMKGIAEVLGEIGHPEATRLAKDAEAFRQDIRQAARRAMVEAPVVKLLDGTYVPHVPTRTGIRGRDWGWFREAAYGSCHLLEANVFEPNEEEMTWVLQDLEDNLFVSREWGRPVDMEKGWFSQGGVTIQANLMDTAIDYLRRGEVKHGLRALFNNFGASLYPDLRCFTEHPVIEPGWGVGPFYKTPDEAKALVWLRAFLLHESGEALHLALGAPSAWYAAGQSFGVEKMATFYGPVTYQFASGADESTAEVQIAAGRAPKELVVHFHQPEGKALSSVTVNGKRHAAFEAGGAVRIASPSGKLVVRARYK